MTFQSFVGWNHRFFILGRHFLDRNPKNKRFPIKIDNNRKSWKHSGNFWMDRSILPFSFRGMGPRVDSSYVCSTVYATLHATCILFITLAVNGKSRRGKKGNDFSLKDSLAV